MASVIKSLEEYDDEVMLEDDEEPPLPLLLVATRLVATMPLPEPMTVVLATYCVAWFKLILMEVVVADVDVAVPAVVALASLFSLSESSPIIADIAEADTATACCNAVAGVDDDTVGD